MVTSLRKCVGPVAGELNGDTEGVGDWKAEFTEGEAVGV